MSRLDPGQLCELINERSVYIWGAGHMGTSMFAALNRYSIPIEGFVDTYRAGAVFCGLPVISVEAISGMSTEDTFIIISTSMFANEIRDLCTDIGFQLNKDIIEPERLKETHYQIEVSGYCNLRCKTCGQGNYHKREKGPMMSVETYREVLDKVLIEEPFLGDVQLYMWGEPLLNKNLPEIIEYTNKFGVAVAVSSNLSVKADLEKVVKAGPRWFRISVSGFEESAPYVHVGSKWSLVKDNMEQLSRLREEFNPDMFIEVNFHLYKHNVSDAQRMKELCDTLGFHLHTNYAFMDSLDTLLEYMDNGRKNPVVEDCRDLLLMDVDEAIDNAAQKKSMHCPCENIVGVRTNGTVMTCAHLYDWEHTLEKDFINTPISDIKKKLKKRDICKKCKGYGLHLYYNEYLNRGNTLESIEKFL